MKQLFVERRRVQRVRLIEPLRGTLGEQRIYVIDVSLRGVRIAHQEPIGAPGERHLLRCDWAGRPIEVKCELVRTQVHRHDAARGRTLFHSGLVIRQISGLSSMALRELIESHVERALDEQKANARGVAAIAPQSFQTGRAAHFTRHEFHLGRWRETATMDSSQPDSGFTVAADHTPQEVELLRRSFERGDRDLIRKLAAMSISTAEGIPTRRFLP